MAVTLTPVNRGTVPGDQTGDTPYVAFGKVNDNDTALKAAADLILDVPQDRIMGRATASTGDVEQLTGAQARTIIGALNAATNETITGDWTFSNTQPVQFNWGIDIGIAGGIDVNGNATLQSLTVTGSRAGTPATMAAFDATGKLIEDTLPSGGGAFTADATTAITPSTSIVLDEASGTEHALDLSFEVNKAADGYNGIYMDVTRTSVPGSSTVEKFIRLSVGGATKFAVNYLGGFDAYASSNVFGNVTAQMISASSGFSVGSSVYIWRNTTSDILRLSGSSNQTSAAQMLLYGESHATQANDIEFYDGATVALQYDASANSGSGLWDFTTVPVEMSASIIIMDGLPTSDPAVVGRLWNNSGVLTVSAG